MSFFRSRYRFRSPLRRLRFSTKLRCLHIANHVALGFGVIYGEWWMWLGSLLIWNIIGSFGVSIGYHRLLSHRSFRTYPWFEKFCVFLGCLATGGTPLGWVGAHRLHHAYPDKAGDPHSTRQIGFWRTYFHYWGKFHISHSTVRDLLRKPYILFIQRYYFILLLVWAGALYAIHPLLGVFVYSVPAVIAFHAFGLINSLGHTRGYRTYATRDSSRNNWFVNLFTCGEGWHNNHHQFPNNHRIGLAAREYDLSAFLLEKLPVMLSEPRPVTTESARQNKSHCRRGR